MMEDDEFLALVEEAFPTEPIPHRFFSDDCDRSSDPDIRDELSKRIERRLWSEVTILDWRMIGVSPVLVRFHLEPEAFIYYLPSLLIGGWQDLAFIDFALEAILPYSKFRISRGKWWSVFYESVSPNQRKTLSGFLLRIRRDAWNQLDLVNQALAEHAERIWLQSGK